MNIVVIYLYHIYSPTQWLLKIKIWQERYATWQGSFQEQAVDALLMMQPGRDTSAAQALTHDILVTLLNLARMFLIVGV